jgi:pimeloyl-ACP methyl ester carboxylesterase
MGHSFGGQVALRVAASSLSKLSGLVLIAPSGIIDRSWFKQAKRGCFRLVAKLGSGLLKLFGQKKGSTLHNFFQKQLYFFVQEKDYLEATSILKETMTKVLMDEIIDDLPQITVPALIFWGDRDSFTPVKHAALVTSLIPRAQLKLMRGEGHRPYYTQPEFIAENVINFIHDNAI